MENYKELALNSREKFYVCYKNKCLLTVAHGINELVLLALKFSWTSKEGVIRKEIMQQ